MGKLRNPKNLFLCLLQWDIHGKTVARENKLYYQVEPKIFL